MFNASCFGKEEKLALTKVVKILRDAKSTAVTICFNKKVDEKLLQERLAKVTQDELKNSKKLAQELLTGEEKTLTARLSKTEGKLGRSLMVNLPRGDYF